MDKDLKRTRTAIDQLIKPFVQWRSYCLCRRGLFKFKAATPTTTAVLRNISEMKQFFFMSPAYFKLPLVCERNVGESATTYVK